MPLSHKPQKHDDSLSSAAVAAVKCYEKFKADSAKMED